MIWYLITTYITIGIILNFIGPLRSQIWVAKATLLANHNVSTLKYFLFCIFVHLGITLLYPFFLLSEIKGENEKFDYESKTNHENKVKRENLSKYQIKKINDQVEKLAHRFRMHTSDTANNYIEEYEFDYETSFGLLKLGFILNNQTAIVGLALCSYLGIWIKDNTKVEYYLSFLKTSENKFEFSHIVPLLRAKVIEMKGDQDEYLKELINIVKNTEIEDDYLFEIIWELEKFEKIEANYLRIELLNSFCKKNDAYAYSSLATIYKEGKIINQDDQKAFELYLKGAELGSDTYYSEIGLCYLYGEGTNIDYQKGINYLTSAFLHGDKMAPMYLSWFYGEDN